MLCVCAQQRCEVCMLMSVLFESKAPFQTMTANYCLASAASRNDGSDVDQAANDVDFV